MTQQVPSPPSQWLLLQKDVVESLGLWRLWTHLGWMPALTNRMASSKWSAPIPVTKAVALGWSKLTLPKL